MEQEKNVGNPPPQAFKDHIIYKWPKCQYVKGKGLLDSAFLG